MIGYVPECTKGIDGSACNNARVGPKTIDQCSRCWIIINNPGLSVPQSRVATHLLTNDKRLDRCIFLGKQTEFKSGCRTGIGCLHECSKDLPAIPNRFCQKCPLYKAHKRKDPTYHVPWVGDWEDFTAEDSTEEESTMDEVCSYRSPQTYPASRFPGKRGRVPLDTVYYQCRKLRSFVSPTGVGNQYCGVNCKFYTTQKHQHSRPLNRRAGERMNSDMLLQCTNRGPLTNDTIPCESCPGRTELKLYKCEKHTVCTISKKGDDESIACCNQCKDFTLDLPEENSIPAEVTSGRKLTWQYGLTTIRKRAETTLPKTIASLKTAGFERPHLFVDGDYDGKWWKTMFGFDVTCRYPRVRTFGNWVLSLAELYVLNPNADRYAIFQDDFVTYPNLRDYLDRTPYPSGGYLNLYSFPVNERLSNGKLGFYPADQTGQGAVALVFSQPAVRALVNCQYMVDRPLDAARGWRAVDGGIVTAMKRKGWREYVHNPSLVQHIGHVSSMGNGRHASSRTFRGENFNAMRLIEERTGNPVHA